MNTKTIADIVLISVFVISIMLAMILPIFAPQINTAVYWWTAIITGITLY